jgi:8-oxo-dGTP pyrophosphatase MutT (NUDIX family)
MFSAPNAAHRYGDTVPTMLAHCRTVTTEQVDTPTVPEHIADLWQHCLDEADYTIAANDHWNRPAPAVVSVTDTRGNIWIGWCPADYKHHLAAHTLAAYIGKKAPAWMLTAAVDIATPLWCRDGLVRTRRSKNCLEHPGTWQHATVEKIEPDDLDNFNPATVAKRALSEELGIDPDTLTADTALYSRDHRNGWRLTFYIPTYCDLSYRDIEHLRQDAPGRWDTDDLELAPHTPWDNQLPGLEHPAPHQQWCQQHPRTLP